MTLLTICQSVARIIKIEVPTTIINNTGEEAAMLLQCAQDEGEALARRPQGGWDEMMSENDFTTVCYGPLTATVANTASNGDAQVSGLVDTSIYTEHIFGATGTGIPYNTVIRRIDSPTQVTLSAPSTHTGTVTDLQFGQFGYPLPGDFQRAIDNTFWDRSRYWQMRGPLSPQQWQFYKSSIYSRATIQRRFRFKNISGTVYLLIDPVPTDNGSDLVYEYVSNGWCQSSLGVRQTQWLADTDTGVLDEYLMRLGVLWRGLDRLGMDYSSALDTYEREVNKAVAQNGSSATLNIAPGFTPFLLSAFGVQDGNFPGPGV